MTSLAVLAQARGPRPFARSRALRGRSSILSAGVKGAAKLLEQLEAQIEAAIALGERDEGPPTSRPRWSIKPQARRSLVLDERTATSCARRCRRAPEKMNKGEVAPRSVWHAFFAVRTMFEHALAIDERTTANPCAPPKGYLPASRTRIRLGVQRSHFAEARAREEERGVDRATVGSDLSTSRREAEKFGATLGAVRFWPQTKKAQA